VTEIIAFAYPAEGFRGWLGMEYSIRRESRHYYILRVTGTATEIMSFGRVYPYNATWVAMYQVDDPKSWERLNARLETLTELKARSNYEEDMKFSIELLGRLAKRDGEKAIAEAFKDLDERMKNEQR
jgi:hypothetical protein